MLNRNKQSHLPSNLLIPILFLGVIALYFILIVPTLKRQGISWDEEIDLRIARAYLTPRGLFYGLSLDLSQTRLPMFVVALVYWLYQGDNLFTARLISVLVGALTIWGVYRYGEDNFNNKVGLLAAFLLAISPFFLSFARVAFTETDIYLACTLTWLLVLVSRFLRAPSVGNAAAAGILLGLCISSKATILVIIPALWIVSTLNKILLVKDRNDFRPSPSRTLPGYVIWVWTGWIIVVLLGGIYLRSRIELGDYPPIIHILAFTLVFLGWLAPFGWAIHFRDHSARALSLVGFMTVFGMLTFLIFPPDHLNNSGIIRSIFMRAGNEMSFNPAFVLELTGLHTLSILLKSTPGIGFALIVSAALSVTQWRRPEISLLLLVGASYFAGLLMLPLGQTFYTVPLLPILSLLAAHQCSRLWVKYHRIALVVAALTGAWWSVEMMQCYPDYNLNGYQWLGERPVFGRSSIGYRSVVYTPSDGIQQIMEWLNENASSDQSALLYVEPWHIVRHFAPEPNYQLIHGWGNPDISQKHDYIAFHIDAVLSLKTALISTDSPRSQIPFDTEILHQEYEQIFSVKRAFDLEFASIWRRK
jgi:hypothetical protein